MRAYNISHYKGKQYRYIKFLCGKTEKNKLLRESKIDLNLPYPKKDDLSWRLQDLESGKWVNSNIPPYITDFSCSEDKPNPIVKKKWHKRTH